LGRRPAGGLPEKVPENYLINILIDYPYQESSDIIFGDKPYLECFGVVNGEYWRNGFDDKLFSGWRQLEWSELRVKSVDIIRYWPYPNSLAALPEAEEVAKRDIEPPFEKNQGLARSSKLRPAQSAVSIALTKLGLEKSRPNNLTYAQIARRIAPVYGRLRELPVQSANEQAALEKVIERYYRAVGKDGT
jgi:hypothetical protein